MKKAIASILLFTAFAAFAQVADPTVPSAKMADAMRKGVAAMDDLRIRALVVGDSDDGIALVGSNGFVGGPLRAGDSFEQDVGGVKLAFTIKSVTARGVEIASDSLDAPIFLKGGFSALDVEAEKGVLRYIECSEVPIETLFRLISDQTGVNISTSAATAGTKVSIFLRNVDPEMAVEEICRATGLWYRQDQVSGIVRVTTMDEYGLSLASFREEQTATFTLMYPNVIEVASVIYGLYPERVMMTLGEDEILDDEENDIARRFGRFNTLADNGGSSFLNMDVRSTSGGAGSSTGAFSFNNGRTTVVPQVSAPPALTQDDAKAINSGDLAKTNDVNGVFGMYQSRSANIFVTVSRRNSMLVVRTSDAKAMEDITKLVKRLDVPTPMVLLEVKVLELDVTDGFNSSFEYQWQEKGAGDPDAATDNMLAGFQGLNPLASEGRSDTLTFQLLSENFQARIQLLEEQGNAKTLATPTLLTANNEVSRLFIGEERPMVRNITSQTIANGDTSITVPQTDVQMQAVGTMLLITPNINADRTVTLRLLQENSEIKENAASIPVYSSNGGGIVQNVPVDVVSSRSITGTFVAKDESAIAIGGLIKETEAEKVKRIPVLGRIPLLGFLFRSTVREKRRTEMVMLVKPHVISTPAEGAKVSGRVLNKLSAHPARDGRPQMGVLGEQGEGK